MSADCIRHGGGGFGILWVKKHRTLEVLITSPTRLISCDEKPAVSSSVMT